ncbi:MAG: NAD(P)-dependent alcohol dehydrogenase [Chlamydiota bacterium]
MNIQAFAATAPKNLLEAFSYPEPDLAPTEVLIEVTHCGLCHSDIHLIDNDWKRSIYPLVPGHEVIGKIVKKGSQVSFPLGARVGCSWFFSSCLDCSTCLSGDNQFCAKRKATCIGHHGGFATHMTADSRFIFAIPEKLDSAVAAPLLCAGATVYSPFRRFKIQATDRVAVLGIGGLGHLAIQFGKAFGCSVTAISTSPGKENECRAFGAEHFLTLDQIASKPAEFALSFDYILSTVHSTVDWNLICSLLKHTGTLCLLGKSPEPMSINGLSSFSSHRSITGSSLANRFQINEMLHFAAEHQIAPQIELMPMSQINEGLERLRQNKARYRIVLVQDGISP